HQTILSDALLIEKAKMLANELGVPKDKLQFSSRWLQKFKERNGVCQRKLYGEADSVDLNVIARSLLLLNDLCARYSLNQIYNMDEMGLFYWLEPDKTLATQCFAGCKKNKECLSIALCTNADGSHKLNLL
ncbi:32553_t:CDS:2, partial [Racocetra persica]